MKHKGFTLVEVALFLGLTGLLFVGIIAGTSNSIVAQRFFDSTQSFAEFLRSVYSQVSNVEGVGTGRSDLAIYGKMISFGQRYDLTGERIPDDEQKIFIYDVVGSANVDVTGSGAAADLLYNVGANVAIVTATDVSGRITDMTVAGIAETYEPRWGATIERTDARESAAVTDADNNLYEGTILVVRHPMSGTVNTLVSPAVIKVNELVLSDVRDYQRATTMLTDVLNILANEDETTHWQEFKIQEVDFCVNPGGMDEEAPLRWNVRLIENARNASGVETIDRNDFTLNDGDGVRNMCQPEEH